MAAVLRALAQETAALSCEVRWDSLGKDFKDSMPIGNGDIGLNVWTESNGDLVFLIGKTDAYTEVGQLIKPGRVRVKLIPNPFTGSKFQQVLWPRQGEIDIQGGSSSFKIWVDANHPVAHFEFSGEKPVEAIVSVETWRLQPREVRQGGAEMSGQGALRELNNIPEGKLILDADTILPTKNNMLIWCHHNSRSIYPLVFENQHLQSLLEKYPDPLLYRTMGCALKGAGLASVDDQTLRSTQPQKKFQLDLYLLTQRAENIDEWQAALGKLIADTDVIDLEAARKAHQQWWSDFWDRSWIHVSGSTDAEKVTQGYAMQRWMNAGGGRGSIPIKYNGSIFTVGKETPLNQYDPAKGDRNADHRNWGNNLWFQNTRLIYWPMIAAGDYDLLAPFLKMYSDALPLAKDRTKIYFKHEGACFPETIYFWGLPNNNDFGWNNPDVIIRNTWIRYYVSGGLELTAIMLDCYDYTQDPDFAKTTLIPLAEAITTYYDQHWKRDASGKIHMDPNQALETRQQAVNPAPDIAGLMCVLPRLIALPENLTTYSQRIIWKKMLADLPPIPLGKTGADGKIPPDGQADPNGQTIILPAEKYSKPNNVENVELYTLFPYHIYGVGLPDLDIAKNTYAAKLFKSSTCWGHDGLDSAVLGVAKDAQAEVVANFTAYGREKFKWFWRQGHDYEPDMDNGGVGMSILQLMLIQNLGDKILLFPAWPKNWDVDFKLRAPKNTVIEGVFKDGRLEKLKVTPESREKDIVKMSL